MKKLKGKKVLITAGPTREYIDPVRFISNDSSGKMGYSIAEAAREAGARVTLVSGPTNLDNPKGVKFISVISAEDMYKATLKEYKKADIIICAAAVADFKPKKASINKIKKHALRTTHYALQLRKTKDILETLGVKKQPHQLLIGFALETENIIKNAKKKLKKKNCDLIIANSNKNIGSSKGSIHIINSRNKISNIKTSSKTILARNIITYLCD